MKISVTALALAACAALVSCNISGKPGALADVVTPAGSSAYTLVAIITKDDKEIDRLPFLRGGVPIAFEDKDTCEAFMQLPFYPTLHEGLIAYVSQEYGPDAKADESCVPAEQ